MGLSFIHSLYLSLYWLRELPRVVICLVEAPHKLLRTVKMTVNTIIIKLFATFGTFQRDKCDSISDK